MSQRSTVESIVNQPTNRPSCPTESLAPRTSQNLHPQFATTGNTFVVVEDSINFNDSITKLNMNNTDDVSIKSVYNPKQNTSNKQPISLLGSHELKDTH